MIPTIRYRITRADIAIHQPAYKTDGASGMDLTSVVPHIFIILRGETARVPLGFAIELPPGYEAQIRPRSSLSARGIVCHLGTIDSDYRGELMAVLTNTSETGYPVHPRDRIAQLVIAPVERVRLFRTDELSETARGGGGFGSTGR